MSSFKHIRFDWAAKKMLREKANFDILEGFLSELLKEDIIIEGILESESNQEDDSDKFNRVDLFAENSNGERIIIEIQNTRELDYLYRMLYGTSKAIVENIKLGDKYNAVKKIISISILYFDIGKGDDYIYVGQTKFTGYHSHKEMKLTKSEQKVLKKPFVHQAFPEYYLIQTGKFSDIIKDSLDEWIYFFKNSEVLDNFRAKGMSAVREKLDVMRMSETDRRRYDRFMENLSTEASIAYTMKFDEEERAIAEAEVRQAREEAKIAIAKAEAKAEETIAKAEAKAEETIANAEAKAEETIVKAEAKAEEAVAKANEAEAKANEAKAKAEEAEAKAEEKFLENSKIVAIQLIKLNLTDAQIEQATKLTIIEIQKLRDSND